MTYVQQFAVLLPILLLVTGALLTAIWKIMRSESKLNNQRIVDLMVAMESHKTILIRIETRLESLASDFEKQREISYKHASQLRALFKYIDSPKRASER